MNFPNVGYYIDRGSANVSNILLLVLLLLILECYARLLNVVHSSLKRTLIGKVKSLNPMPHLPSGVRFYLREAKILLTYC